MHANSLTRTWWVRACWPASTPNHCFSCRYARIAEVEVLTDGRLMLKWAHDTIDDAEETLEGCLMVGARVVSSWATDDTPAGVLPDALRRVLARRAAGAPC